MDNIILILLIVAAVLFLISLIFSINKDIRWVKFFAFALMILALDSMFVIRMGTLDPDLNRDLKIAGFVFLFLAFIFYRSYVLKKKDSGSSNK